MKNWWFLQTFLISKNQSIETSVQILNLSANQLGETEAAKIREEKKPSEFEDAVGGQSFAAAAFSHFMILSVCVSVLSSQSLYLLPLPSTCIRESGKQKRMEERCEKWWAQEGYAERY